LKAYGANTSFFVSRAFGALALVAFPGGGSFFFQQGFVTLDIRAEFFDLVCQVVELCALFGVKAAVFSVCLFQNGAKLRSEFGFFTT
jgi:hypothetical protein